VLSVGGAVGSRASAGGTGFIVLGDLSTLGVSRQFTEADIGRLAVGQVAAVTLPGRDPIPGKVSQIDPAGTITNRLVRYGVVIAFDRCRRTCCWAVGHGRGHHRERRQCALRRLRRGRGGRRRQRVCHRTGGGAAT
jgi:hypothetical protein